MTTTATKTTTTATTCSHLACTEEADGQPWVFGLAICWLHRLTAAGRRAAA